MDECHMKRSAHDVENSGRPFCEFGDSNNRRTIYLRKRRIRTIGIHSEIIPSDLDTSPLFKEMFKSIGKLSDLVDVGEAFAKLSKLFNHDLNLIKLWTPLDWHQIKTFKCLSSASEELSNLNKMIGLEDLKEFCVDQMIVLSSKMSDDERPYMHTLILGPPGHGKTEIARHLGKIFCKSGFLKSDKFVVAKRSDLIGKYCGHTAVATTKMFMSAKGGILFIDEIYSLGNKEQADVFTKECIDTLTHLMDLHKDTVVMGNGYEKETRERFLAYNPGLARRIPWIFVIGQYNGDDLKRIFKKLLLDDGWTLDKVAEQSLNFGDCKMFPNAGGDMFNLASYCKSAHMRRTFRLSSDKIITEDDLNQGLKKYHLRRERENNGDEDSSPPPGLYL